MRFCFLILSALMLFVGGLAAAQTLKDEGRFGALEITSGFEPDPHAIEVRSGGKDSVTHLGTDCVGYIDNNEPDYVLAFTSGEYILAFFVESSADTTLVVRTPEGGWICNDDYNEVSSLNPAIMLEAPSSGTYHVWVGALAPKAYADAILNISEKLPFPAGVEEVTALGDDTGEYANDGECDDPRYGGDLESHRGRDATDCATYLSSDYGDDAGEYANDGECDDPRFGGEFDDHRGHDASDCRASMELNDDQLGDDRGLFANDGECDDPRFGGILNDHRGHDATDCAAALAGGSLDEPPAVAAGDSQPPVIEIAETIETHTGAAEISGRAYDETRLRRVMIDGRAVPFDSQGHFMLFHEVDVGSHEVVVAAADRAGNTTEVLVTVQSIDSTPPLIEAPFEVETADSHIEFEAFVRDRSKVALLTVDGQPADLSEQGFTVRRTVPIGETMIMVVAVDEWGNQAEHSITVVRTRGATATPPKEPLPIAEPAAKLQRRTALVIGNSDYADSPLTNPAHDARLMAEVLRERGFEVVTLIDAKHREMRLAIIEFGDLLAAGGVGLFYYAGHGMQVGGENYLIPIDAEISREAHVPVEGVNVNHVLARMDGARNSMNIVILDACRNNPFGRSFRSNSSGLAQMLAPTGTYIAYATAPGAVAADGEGENSPFTSAIAEAVNIPGLPLEQAFKHVRKIVRETTNGQQVPWTSSSLGGDFYFRPATVGRVKARN